jgi:multiple sugar transport system substrate-binding protein
MMFIGVATAAALAIAGTVTYNVVKSNSAKSESAVTWWVPDWDYKAATTVVAEFQKQNPDVKVELVQTTGDTVANRTGVG